ncbi:MAG: AAA family ATPase [Clostridium sp.]|nr:MAG: AAA family ATPase [Clostridium sp.]
MIFDEVQECPNIISALKYFCQDFSSIPVIATGSMVRIKLQRESKKEKNLTKAVDFFFQLEKLTKLQFIQ